MKRTWTLLAVALLIALPLLVASCGTTASSSSSPNPNPGNPQWNLVWSDEFSGTNGSAPDPTKWNYDLGGNGWGNNELECYTNSTQNAFVQDGNLVIQALQDISASPSPPPCSPDGTPRSYTSARILTSNSFSQAYGRFEARIKIPYGQGMWPAFWMLGNNISQVQWPTCGEIDIMENIGKEPSIIYGSAHGPGYTGGTGVGAAYTLPGGANFSDDFHIFAVEWAPNVIRYYVDSNLYETITPSSLPSGATWVFDHPFFIILNVAVGGDWPGPPDSTTVFPQQMLVDYVRVYQQSN